MSFAIYDGNQIVLWIHNFNKNRPLLVLMIDQM